MATPPVSLNCALHRLVGLLSQQQLSKILYGYDIRTVQEFLGHKDFKTTMIYTHVLNRGGNGVRSHLDP